MLMKLLEIRTILLKVYQKGRFLINPFIKFIVSHMVLSGLTDAIGYDSRFSGGMIIFLLSVICAVLPGGVLVFVAMLLSLLHVYSVSMFLAGIMLLAYMVLYGMIMRFAPKYAMVAVLLPVLAKYNLHYAVPLVLGCIGNPLAILPTIAGVFIYYMLMIVKVAASREVNMNLDDIIQLFTDIADAVMANKQMFIMMIVFSLVIITVFLIRKLSFDHAFEVSIGAGMVVNLMGFLVADLRYDVTVNVGVLMGMTIVSGFITYIADYMKRVLDYTAVERVQFEDDDYYYYVKAVPKVNVSIPKHNVRSISREDYEEDEAEEEEAEDSQDIYGEAEAEEADDRDFNVAVEEFDFDKARSLDEEEETSAAGIKRLGARLKLLKPDEPAEYEEEMSLEDFEDDSEDNN